jgi:hypothetical protein
MVLQMGCPKKFSSDDMYSTTKNVSLIETVQQKLTWIKKVQINSIASLLGCCLFFKKSKLIEMAFIILIAKTGFSGISRNMWLTHLNGVLAANN